MSTIIIPELQVRKDQLRWYTEGTGFSYSTTFQDGREGYSELLIRPITDYEVTGFYDFLLGCGLEPDATLGHTNLFYPNGRGLDGENPAHRRFMKLGNGSRVLEMITEDALDQGARLLYAFSDQKSMQDFLDKKGFSFIKQRGPKVRPRSAYRFL